MVATSVKSILPLGAAPWIDTIAKLPFFAWKRMRVSDCVVGNWRMFSPVSYTHLDVYKRQLEGTTQYNEVLANTKLKNVIDYQTPKPKGAAGYTFDKWIVKQVSNKEGIEIKDPSEYTITENTVFYAYFAKDEHGTDPIHPDHGDGIPDKYQVEVNLSLIHILHVLLVKKPYRQSISLCPI